MDNIYSKLLIAPTYNFKQVFSIPQAFTIITWLTFLTLLVLNLIIMPAQLINGVFSWERLIFLFVVTDCLFVFIISHFGVLPGAANYNLILFENRMFYVDQKKQKTKHICRTFKMFNLFFYVVLYDGVNLLILPNCGNVAKFLKDVAHTDI